MPVELTILSGAREGEAIQLDLDAFRVGDDPAAEVAFDPRHDPAGRGCLALVMREEAGWRIQNQGRGPLLVNHTVVDGRVPLRSGDIIRLSDMGPDVCFNLISASRTGGLTPTAAADAIRETREANLTQASGRETRETSGVPLRRGATAVAALCLLAVVVIGLRFVFRVPNKPMPTRPSAPMVNSDTVPDVPIREVEDNKKASPSSTPGASDAAGSEAPVQTPASLKSGLPVTALPPNPWQSALTAVAPAVCLLVVETPDRSKSFPCGTACAIREDALLTNGMLAAELENKRRKDWRVKAFWPNDGLELPVREILVHRGFNETVETPEKQIYFELAILLLDGKCQAVAALAEPNELAEIEAGLPLACAGISHRGLPRTSFDNPRVEQSMTRVYLREPLVGLEGVPSSGAPVVLHLTGDFPKNIFGSPLVNAAGRIVGTYADKADLPEADVRAGLELHYALLVTLARAYLAGKNMDDWIHPECPDNKKTPTPSRP